MLTPAAGRNGTVRAQRFREVRARTVDLVAPLTPDDCQVQSMPDASPAKWHLAHTSWFFDTFVLAARGGYEPFDESFRFLFNSYYHATGTGIPERPERGLVTRPGLAEVLEYRAWVDERVAAVLDEPDMAAVVELGLQHEQQHQELLLTDILHAFWSNPLRPAYRADHDDAPTARTPLSYIDHPEGFASIGAGDDGFAFDNERPRHRVWLRAFSIASRPATNAEYRAFIDDGGYARPELWLSDGWALAARERWRHPLYWTDDLTHEFTLGGTRPLAPHAPVRHLCLYEADAFARWAGARLPTEAEWERASPDLAGTGRVWEWTGSAYLGYPGFRPEAGAVGEYNGKFMSGQMVLRGGSAFSAPGHLRATYRNFFPPAARWQCAGVRLARDA